MYSKILSAIVVGGCAAVVAFTIAYEHSLFVFVVALSALLGAAIGWKWASQRNVRRAIRIVEEAGGIEQLLDRSGREMLTLWIPLDHKLTEDDRRFAKELGHAFSREVARGIASYCALETSQDEVGLMFIGPDAEVMLQEIRQYFASRCPRGSYVTRRRVPRRDDPDQCQFDLWPGGKSLIEEDVGLREQ